MIMVGDIDNEEVHDFFKRTEKVVFPVEWNLVYHHFMSNQEVESFGLEHYGTDAEDGAVWAYTATKVGAKEREQKLVWYKKQALGWKVVLEIVLRIGELYVFAGGNDSGEVVRGWPGSVAGDCLRPRKRARPAIRRRTAGSEALRTEAARGVATTGRRSCARVRRWRGWTARGGAPRRSGTSAGEISARLASGWPKIRCACSASAVRRRCRSTRGCCSLWPPQTIREACGGLASWARW